MPRARSCLILDWIERRHRWVAAAACALLLTSLSARAYAKPFWHDEIYTIVETDLPSVGEIWRAERDGLDLLPPLNSLLTRGVRAVLGAGRVSTRLPAMLGFASACGIVFAFVRRRADSSMALVAAALLTFTCSYRFAYEARPYGLMLGLSALALYSWSEAAAGRHRSRNLATMALALCAAMWAQYFSILLLLPIAVAELWRQVSLRRADWSMWAALAAALAGLLPLWPLITAAHSEAGGFWGSASSFGPLATYAFLFLPVSDWGVLVGYCVIAIWTLWLIAVFEPATANNGANAQSRKAMPSYEIVAGVALAALPCAGVALGRIVGSGLVPRYVLPTTLAGAILLSIALDRLTASPARRLLLLTLAALGWLGIQMGPFLPGHLAFRDPVRDDRLILQQLDQPGPIAVTNGIVFLQLWYYAPENSRAQLVYLADQRIALARTGSSTIDRNLLTLARWSPVPVVDFEQFVRSHEAFRVYAPATGWLLTELRQRHFALEPSPEFPNGRLYMASGR